MIAATLISGELNSETNMFGDEVRTDHVQTKHGLTSVKSVLPVGATEDLFVSGGLLSGCSYDRYVNLAAEAGYNARTVRLAGDGFYGAIDADAEELAGSIEVLAGDRPTHVTAHSLGARVAVKAAAMLDESIDLRSLTLVGGALKRSKFPRSGASVVGALCEGIVSVGRIKEGSRGVIHQLSRRPVGVMGEVFGLFFDNDDLTPEMSILKAREVRIIITGGSFDHFVPPSDIQAVSAQFPFIEVMEPQAGIAKNTHFALLTSDSFAASVLPPPLRQVS
jgi:pimeloyl-ACP methyl ester carboxylesterase